MNQDKNTNDSLEPTLGMESTSGQPAEPLGKQIGPFRLLRILGEGGMGTVYLAEQSEPIQRQVALKIIKLGMDTKEVVARFESERQVLARMSHPNIAKVFDAGATEQGRPYFVMEYVAGVPLTDYCDQHRLVTKARLEIFIDICQAVHHAHQKGIIHRDLKPQNVLVEEADGKPIAKVIDFGVAKATDQSLTEKTMFTRQGSMLGTPAYMSPEQAEMSALDMETTTDVYSLGVMLYELLAGFLPLDPKELRDAGWQGIQEKIRDHQPKRISTQLGVLGAEATALAAKRSTTVARLARQCRDELDWIALRAMEKDRARRYQSASEFAADIRRYLADEPVLAHRPSLRYQARKLIVRHKYRFGLLAGMLLVMIGFTVMTTVQSRRIALERDRANEEAETATQVSEFMVRLFEVSNPSKARGDSVTAREILDEGALRIKSELEDQPHIMGRLMEVLGEVYVGLGLYEQAVPLLNESLELALQDEKNLDLAEMYSNLGELELRLGHYEKSEEYFKNALEVDERNLGPDHTNVASSLNNLGLAQMYLGDLENARQQYERSLAIKEKILDPDDPKLAISLSSFGSLLMNFGDSESAMIHYKRALDIQERVLGSDHYNTIITMSNIGALLGDNGDYAGAVEILKEVLEHQKQIMAIDHPDIGRTCLNLGYSLHSMKDYEGAKIYYEKGLEIQGKAFGEDSPKLIITNNNFGVMLKDTGNFAEAKVRLEQAVGIMEKSYGVDSAMLVGPLNHLVDVYTALGETERVEEVSRRIEGIKVIEAGE